MRASTLLVSKPIAPPWNDSGKNLVRDLVRHCTDVEHHVLTVPGFSLELDHVTEEPLYASTGTFSPGLWQNARVLWRLLRPDRQSIYHFFFAPNPRTSTVARWASRLKGRRTVQTVMSVPREFEGVEALLFAERVVALSEHTAHRLSAAGVEGVVHIPPGIAPPPPLAPGEALAYRTNEGLDAARSLVVFPGDFEFSRAAYVFAGAAERLADHVDATFVFACRAKREKSREIEQELRERLAHLVERKRVRFLGETPKIRRLLAAADVVTLPMETTYAKMDIPLVLLEAMAEGTPVVVADVAPLNEVLGTDLHAPPEPVGLSVPPLDVQALADALGALLSDETRRHTMGRAGSKWVDQRYHARSMGAAHTLLYQSLAAGT